MDRFQEMQAFVAVANVGSFVGAAEALQISKTAMSRLVGDLETRLGVRLLHRTTRRLSLTEEGERFLERCRGLLADLDEAESELTTRRRDAVGTLRVNVPVSFGLLHLAPLWPAFMARHPGVLLDVTLADRVVDLVDEGYDLAVRIARLPASTLVSRRLASTRLVLCASPTYLRRHGKPKQPADLAQHAVLAYTLLATGEQWHFTGPNGPESVRVTPRMLSNSGDTCCAAALSHEGIVLQPSFMVSEALRTGALVEVMPSYRASEFGIYALYPSRQFVTPKVRALVEFLAQAFVDPSWERPTGAAAAR